MVDLMPYHLEKGPPWSVVESIATESKQSLYDELTILRNTGQLMTESRAYSSSNLNAGPTPTTEARVKHMLSHWFGMVPDNQGGWDAQDPSLAVVGTGTTTLMAPPGSPLWARYENLITQWQALSPNDTPSLLPSTGWWINFGGNVEGVLREGLTRAAELSLGLKHDQKLKKPDSAKQFWPVTINMICPSPWFEVWVEWRSDGKKKAPQGHVAVTVLTPAHPNGNVLTQPAAGRSRLPDFEVDPIKAGGDHGTWVIAEDKHDYFASPPTSSPLPPNLWLYPELGPPVQGTGTVRVVRPAEADGGVLKAGRPWTP